MQTRRFLLFMNSFQEHAANLAAAQGEIAGGLAAANGNPVPNPRLLGPVLIFAQLAVTVPCSLSPMVQDFELIPGGKSVKNFVEKCEFPASDIPQFLPNTRTPVQMKKGTACTLKQFPGDPGLQMVLWAGGYLAGGQVYRFMLVSSSYDG